MAATIASQKFAAGLVAKSAASRPSRRPVTVRAGPYDAELVETAVRRRLWRWCRAAHAGAATGAAHW